MATINSRPDEYVTGAKWFRIEGETKEEVQAAINTVMNWIGFLPGNNAAEFKNPERRGAKYIARGYTLIDDSNTYESLSFE